MTSLGTLELQLTANQAALYQQLNQTRAYATQVAKDIEKQINQAFSGAGGQNIAGLNQSTAQAASAGQAAGKTFTDRFKNAVEPIKSILSNVFNGVFVGAGIGAFNSITGVVGSALGAVQQFAGEIFNVTKDFQGFESSLKTFLKGNQKEIDDFVGKLEKFAATTPFELKNLQQAAIQNLATGAKPDQLIKDLKTIGDVAAGANAQLGDLMEVYAKSRTEGKLQNEDIDQFTGRGVQLLGELAKMLGAKESEIRQLATDGKLEFRHLEEALRRMSAEGGVYFGAMENKAKTLEGRLSNVQDTFYQFQKSIGQAFEPIMNYIIQTFGDIISSLTSSNGIMKDVRKESEKLVAAFKSNPQLIQSLNKAIQELVAGGFKILLDGITSLTKYLETNPNIIRDMSTAFNDFWGVVKGIFDGLKFIFDGIKFVVEGIQAGARGAADIWVASEPTLNNIWQKTVDISKAIADGIVAGWNTCVNLVKSLIKLIQSLFNGVVNLTTNGINLLNAGLKTAVSITQAIGENIGKWTSNIGSAIQKAGEFASQGIPGIGSAFEKAKKKAEEFWKWATGQNQQPTTQPQGQPQAMSPNSGNGNVAGNIVQGLQGLFGLGGSKTGKVAFVENSQSSMDSSGGHMGDDIFAPIGSKIFSPASGTVVQSRVGGTRNTDDANPLVPGYQPQQLVIIKLDVPIEFEGKKITHLNMRHLLNRNVEVGQKVEMGDLLGTVGEAGGRGTQFGTKKPGTRKDADAAHLHIEYSPAENNQRNSLPDAAASRLTAKLSKDFVEKAKANPIQQGVDAAKQFFAPAQNALSTSNAKQGNAVLWGQAANYSPSDLSNLTERGKKAMEALKNPNVRAFLDAVAIAEVGTKGASQGGYGYLIGDDVKGRESFNPRSLQSHPRKRIRYGPGKNQVSSATGRYQIMDFTWDEEAKRLGLKDFKPQSQEILAVSRLMYRGILPAIMAGDFKSVIKRSGNMDASSEWASLEGNPYGQGSPTGKLSLFLSNIEKNLQSQKTQSTPQQSASSQPSVSQQTANSNQQVPGASTGGNRQDKINLEESRRKLAESKYNEIKDGIEAANKEADNRQKQDRENEARRRKLLNDKEQKEFAANEALAPNDAAKKIIQEQAKLHEINNRYNEKLISLNQELEDRIGDEELRSKILAEAQKRKVAVSPSDAGVDYSKSINQLNKEIEQTKYLRDIELATYDLNKFNADKEIERNKDRQREIEKLSRAHEDYINQLKLVQSLSDDATKQNVQSKIDKAGIEHQANMKLMELRYKLYDLQDEKVYLLGKFGLNADSDQVKKLQKEIDNLVATINSIGDGKSIDLKVFENQNNQIEKQNQRLRESEKQEIEHSKQVLEINKQIFTAQTQQQKAELQFQLEIINAIQQEKQALTDLKQQYDDLVQVRELLIKEGKFDAASDVIKALDDKIADLNERIKMVGEQSKLSFETLAKAGQEAIEQGGFADLESALSKEASMLPAQTGLIRRRGGNEYEVSALEAEAARMEEQFRYKQELLQIEKQIAAVKGTANEYTEQETAALKANAEAINKINLEGISQQVRTLGKDLLDVGKNAFGSFFNDIIFGSKSAGDAFKDLVNNIAQQLTQLAVNSLIFSIVGGGGGFFSSLFGGIGGGKAVAKFHGGIIPNYANGGSVGAVADALHRERSMSGGKTPVLAALTPGEMVLTIKQAKRFQELRLDKVLNFANGGVVGGGQNLGNEIGSKNMTINIPVTVEGGGDSSVNVPQLQNSLRSVVLAEIQKQQRPGGALNR